MERLSDNAIEIVNELHTERLAYESEYVPIIDALNRLAEYEDIGLEPEKITLIWKIAHLETLNGVTKAELQSMLKWLVEHHYYCAGEE